MQVLQVKLMHSLPMNTKTVGKVSLCAEKKWGHQGSDELHDFNGRQHM